MREIGKAGAYLSKALPTHERPADEPPIEWTTFTLTMPRLLSTLGSYSSCTSSRSPLRKSYLRACHGACGKS